MTADEANKILKGIRSPEDSPPLYWKHLQTDVILQSPHQPGPGWVKVLCSCPSYEGEDPNCEVHRSH